MFDTKVADLADLAGADESVVIAAIGGWTQIEGAASARRLAAIGELVARRLEAFPERSPWSCDTWDAAAAEVSASMGITHGKASGQMYLAQALRERLPRVAEVFADGVISAAVVSTIAWHTQLIQDADALELVDKALARDVLRYGMLSAAKTAQAIEAIVDQYDPGALRHLRGSARGREVVIDKTKARDGTTPLWGRLYSHDAEVLDRRLMAMAHPVCDDDPRTIAQRRADALAALGAGRDRLVCGCGDPECPAADASGQPNSAVIHVVAGADTIDTPVDPYNSGEGPPQTPIDWDMTLDEASALDPEPDPPAPAKPALVLGGTLMPAPLLAELIRNGATIKPLRLPDPDGLPEPHYRPSTALDEFIRCRDMTCRFPGCDAPAEFCDIDHTTPWGAGGLTHPSNLKALCRKHHLLKTFWTGWCDRQYPDGTVVWTSPSGASYTTAPGSRLLFPALCRPTGELPTPATPQQSSGCKGLAMPLRKRTRAQNRAQAITAERALNAAHIAERNEPPPF